jgi:predicted nucleotide-binding protein (sugar kinase/HSP70/actin superfamily)
VAEVLKSSIPGLPPMLMPHYNRSKGHDTRLSLLLKAAGTGLRVTRNPVRLLSAVIGALRAHRQYLRALILSEKGLEEWEQAELPIAERPRVIENERPLKVALAGHSYVLNDPFASLNIRAILREHGIEVITSEQLPRRIVERQMAKLEYDYYFYYTREILATVMHFLESRTVDGILHIVIFSCGPDSIAAELAARFAKRNPAVPLLQLVFDELTGEAGLRTRVEAFVDMLRRKTRQQAVVQSRMSV